MIDTFTVTIWQLIEPQNNPQKVCFYLAYEKLLSVATSSQQITLPDWFGVPLQSSAISSTIWSPHMAVDITLNCLLHTVDQAI